MLGELCLWGESALCGGESEAEAHARIVLALRAELPDCRVETRWTYLDELPTALFVTEAEDPVEVVR